MHKIDFDTVKLFAWSTKCKHFDKSTNTKYSLLQAVCSCSRHKGECDLTRHDGIQRLGFKIQNLTKGLMNGQGWCLVHLKFMVYIVNFIRMSLTQRRIKSWLSILLGCIEIMKWSYIYRKKVIKCNQYFLFEIYHFYSAI